jgi:hypothetical protein
MHRYRTHDDPVQAVCELSAERKGVVVVVRVTSCAIPPSRAHARGLIPKRKQKHCLVESNLNSNAIGRC